MALTKIQPEMIDGLVSTGVATSGSNVADAVPTDSILINTGNKTAGTGDSGSIRIIPGTSAGGVRGKIQLEDASLSGASIGHVWALSNVTTGAGNWAPVTVASGSVGTAQLADSAVTNVKRGADVFVSGTAAVGEVAHATLTGAFVRSAAGAADVTGLTVTITTKGGAVDLWLESRPSSTVHGSITLSSFTSNASAFVMLDRGGSTLCRSRIEAGGGTQTTIAVPPSSIRFTDRSVVGVPGTYTYKVRCQLDNTAGSPSMIFLDSVFFAKEA